MRVGSLFSGIGGFDLGFERAGMRTEWFVEREPFCQAVLRKHWPQTPIFEDVCLVHATHACPHGGCADCLPAVDLLCGGFPCQDLSAAGKGAGLDGARSGLWSEFARLIGELRPGYVVVENVPVLRSRGLGHILGEMANLGYDAEWNVISAADAGAPHLRKRIWVVAYPQRTGLEGQRPVPREPEVAQSGHSCASVADTKSVRWRSIVEQSESAGNESREPRDSSGYRGAYDLPWAVEPDVGRVAHGIPARMDRLRALGNALVPQIAEWIGHQIMTYEECGA